MEALRKPFTLRNLLRLDAATCAGMGVLLALASGPIAALTQIPAALLFYAGLVLLPIALFMWLVAARPVAGSAGAWLVILGNVGWVAASALLLVSGWIDPNGLGFAVIAGQALVVAALAWLEYAALRGRSFAVHAG